MGALHGKGGPRRLACLRAFHALIPPLRLNSDSRNFYQGHNSISCSCWVVKPFNILQKYPIRNISVAPLAEVANPFVKSGILFLCRNSDLGMRWSPMQRAGLGSRLLGSVQ